MGAAESGAICFGLVVGWVTYRTLIRRTGGAALSDIATVIGAVGGAAVVAIFNDARLFGFYSFGLAVGFFAYFVAFRKINGKEKTGEAMGEENLVRVDETPA